MTVPQRATQVAVAGPSDADDELLIQAAEVGTLLAAGGAVVVVGSSSGVSRAAGVAAAAGGAVVVHLMPQPDRQASLPAATFVLPSGMGELCNGLLVGAADVVLAVGGGWGTLSEVALASRSGVPVVSLSGWTVRDVTGAVVTGVTEATDPVEAVALALSLGVRRTGSPR